MLYSTDLESTHDVWVKSLYERDDIWIVWTAANGGSRFDSILRTARFNIVFIQAKKNVGLESTGEAGGFIWFLFDKSFDIYIVMLESFI